ncbi:Winged helix-turn-helix transcription repressor DNA-binding [Penicillium tannophilum]|nr:Winged helix-turn-helix transcription repressor DNA-binding [Penicillium tannophilum]
MDFNSITPSDSIADFGESEPSYSYAALNMMTSTTGPTGQTAFINQLATNERSTGLESGQQLVFEMEGSGRPNKRLRSSEYLTSPNSHFPVSKSHGQPVTSKNSQPPASNGNKGTGGSMGYPYISGSSNTPADTSSTLSPSVDPRKSTSPLTTPEHSVFTPACVAGVSVLESGKVDLAKCRPRSSIPAHLTPEVYGQQCVASAYACRLDPYSLHPKEQEALQDYLCHMHVTLYLNIRNGILRLWTRNAMVSVTREEALGVAKDYRWMNLASFAHDWLARNGYINFGCVEVPIPIVPPRRGRRREGPVIVVVGAGVGGLGCARQLEGLFRHYRDAETAPRVIVLEGRRRIGGRVYSHPLRSMESASLPPGLVPKAEMGAQIIVGFENGNPLDQIVRSQLALHYHLLHDSSTIYDIDGLPVGFVQDSMNDQLHVNLLERTGKYRHEVLIPTTAQGDADMIDAGRESTSDDGLTVREYEEARRAGTTHLLLPTKRTRRHRGAGHKTVEIEPIDKVAADSLGTDDPAASFCLAIGWRLNAGHSEDDTIELDDIARATPTQTLGAVMDEGVKQYQDMLPMTPKDMRLQNWHIANMEYSNATNFKNLSLSSWDQDTGNEFEGEHSQVIGGYQQLPFGLYSLPTKLDVRTNKIVQSISYDPTGSDSRKSVIQCEDGEKFVADHVVFTGSLGVLKHETIQFNPPLPDWKLGAIKRLGFGLMNKVILVFPEPFWDETRDMFGLLREPTIYNSMNPDDYVKNRGRCYIFWNCMQTAGLPVITGIMAGDAAYETETTSDADIISEVVSQLRNVFKHTSIPDPVETIITRWASDKFTRGSYSYVATEARAEDYDLMARPVGSLHFAGEATSRNHPATVHGAYLSGIRAAAEVIESVVGPIEIPTPLVPEKPVTSTVPAATPNGTQHSEPVMAQQQPITSSNHMADEKLRRETYHDAMRMAISAVIGEAPIPPPKVALNPFLLYQKDFWSKCRDQCEEARRAGSSNPNAKAPRDEIRHALGQMWRNAPVEEKQPYLDQVEVSRALKERAWSEFKVAAEEWDRQFLQAKAEWCAQHPYEGWVTPGSAE